MGRRSLSPLAGHEPSSLGSGRLLCLSTSLARNPSAGRPPRPSRRRVLQIGTAVFAASSVARAVSAGTVAISPTPASAYLPGDRYVETYRQRWALSCEYAALHTALRLLGHDVSEDRMRALLGQGEDPDEVFRGQIEANQTLNDYGVHAKGIARLVGLLKSAGLIPDRIHVRVLHQLDAIRAAIAQGQPVIAWVPLQLRSSSRAPIRLSSGKLVNLVYAEHTVTLRGYDGDRLFALEPYDGTNPTYDAAALTPSMGLFDDPALAIEVVQPVQQTTPQPTVQPSPMPLPSPTPLPTSEHFLETGITLDGGFYRHYRAMGGRGALGVPLIPELYEADDATGADKQVVYTEAARLEWYPQSGSFGLGYVGQEYLGEAAALDPARRLAGAIGRYVAANGGVRHFGYSVSEEVPIDPYEAELLPRPGWDVIGQWFQNGLLLYYPERREVLPGRAGAALARMRELL